MPSENYDFVPWDSPDDIEKFFAPLLAGARALSGKALRAGAKGIKAGAKRLKNQAVKESNYFKDGAKKLTSKISGKTQSPTAPSPASEAVESMPSAPAPEMPEPEMPETPSAPEPTMASSTLNPQKKKNQAMQVAQQALANSQQQKQAQQQRASDMARRGAEVGKAKPMDIAWQLLKMREDKQRPNNNMSTIRRKLDEMNRPAIEQLEEPLENSQYSSRRFPTEENDRRLRENRESRSPHSQMREPMFSMDDIAEHLARRRDEQRHGYFSDRGQTPDSMGTLEGLMGAVELEQSTLPMNLPFTYSLNEAIRNRPDMKVDEDNQTFTRLMSGPKTRKKFKEGYEDRMQYKEGRPTPTKVEVRAAGRRGGRGRNFLLTDDDGRRFSSTTTNTMLEYSPEKVPHLNHTVRGLDSRTPKEHRRQGYYGNLLDTILQNKIGILSDNRNMKYSQPFHEKFQRRLPANIEVKGKNANPSSTFNELEGRTDQEYLYGFNPQFNQKAEDDIDMTGWGDLKPMFGNQYPMFGSMDKPIIPRTHLPITNRSYVQDNTDPTTPQVREYTQSSLDDFNPLKRPLQSNTRGIDGLDTDELARMFG